MLVAPRQSLQLAGALEGGKPGVELPGQPRPTESAALVGRRPLRGLLGLGILGQARRFKDRSLRRSLGKEWLAGQQDEREFASKDWRRSGSLEETVVVFRGVSPEHMDDLGPSLAGDPFHPTFLHSKEKEKPHPRFPRPLKLDLSLLVLQILRAKNRFLLVRTTMNYSPSCFFFF